MEATVMKVEVEAETCCICGGGGDLFAPEEYDASSLPLQVPLRTMLLHLNNNKVVPPGRLCGACAGRAAEAFEFSVALGSRQGAPLSDKIRALRRRLHQLTQHVDVFIVVGGPAAHGRAYSEDDIIMVEKDALAAAAAADEDDLEHARNARGDTVYQCSVCPLSFQRVSEYRLHVSSHPPDALHSCWTCGAQVASRAALQEHQLGHKAAHALVCHLCDTTFQSQGELRRHGALCPPVCPSCGARCPSRGALQQHAAEAHGREGRAPHVCPACLATVPTPDLLSAHLLRHRQAKQFVCGYGDCVLRFATRSNLIAHIRMSHSSEPPALAPLSAPAPPSADATCTHCQRSFASVAALKRHMYVHRPSQQTAPESVQQEEMQQEEEVLEFVVEGEDMETEVEYLEVETLEDAEYIEDEKPNLQLQ